MRGGVRVDAHSLHPGGLHAELKSLFHRDRPCQLRGSSVEAFLTEAQDKSRSALEKSFKAAHSAWAEQLLADQAKFEAELLSCLDGVKRASFFFCGAAFADIESSTQGRSGNRRSSGQSW